ncbi:hypothetical protein AJ80_08539 [Polytolypa hystricis UAMH7299]|uniref:Carboxylesterase type B domain-containing protein n=1 Tax=Polytolypa hystricis (strain UAMH7299) TaxID=1447883 RepID=A0A2B7X5H7_POLH7|nr:hypothetical protein AJ80_08539 [Polytolypa hystricis UAMH7299]
MTSTLQHPALGTITGVSSDGVQQYLGVPYASLAHRFAEPKLFEKFEGGSLDATKFGPSVVSHPDALKNQHDFLQDPLPLPNEPSPHSDTQCLNLNISVPDGTTRTSKLPVLVFIHGGGFSLGSSCWPKYKLARIVKLSADIGSPIIGVGINYRLGAFGFLHSKELQDEGVKANNGLRDQQTSLRWIKAFISGFGGDAERITAIGEMSLTLHLLSQEPLFKQMVDMSGTSLLLKPMPLPVAKFAYSQVAKCFSVESLGAKERVQALLDAPMMGFPTKLPPSIPLLPLLDGDIISANLTFAEWGEANTVKNKVPGVSWCRKVMIGDCQFDGCMFGKLLPHPKEKIAQRFRETASKILANHLDVALSLFEAYNISECLTDEEAFQNILRFINDIAFYAPTTTLARAWAPDRAYVYHFNELNPWEGPNKGEASHALDIAFLFQNYNEFLSEKQRLAAVTFAKHVIAFANEQEPFRAYDAAAGKGAQTYGTPEEGCSLFVDGTEPGDYGRRDVIWKLAESVGLDQLSAVFESFLLGV